MAARLKREDAAPSEKQIALATKLATSNSEEIPDTAMKSGRELSRWIDQRIRKPGEGKSKRKARR